MPRFRVGVNYWPRSSAMYMWERFDRAEIEEDFARIAQAGMDCVRFFLRWESFAPDAQTIERTALERFDTVLTIAQQHGLTTMPTLFCGHMSGVNWLPAWTLDAAAPRGRFRTITAAGESPNGIGDFYADGVLLRAQRVLARALGERARAHPAVFAWDLGNEFSNLRVPASEIDAADWSAYLADELRSSSGLHVTAGTHGEDLTQDRRLRFSSLDAPFAYATMHGYPVYSSFARDRTDPDVVPFLLNLTHRFAGKPVMFTEFGNPQCPSAPAATGSTFPFACLSEEELAVYAGAVLERLHAQGALGALWWCWADYDDALRALPPFDRAPHELHFGVVRSDGSAKPVLRVLSAFARQARETLAAAPPEELNETSFYAALPHSLNAAYQRYYTVHV